MTQSLGGLVISTVQADDERLGGLVVSVIVEYVEGLFGVGGGVEAPGATIGGEVSFSDAEPPFNFPDEMPSKGSGLKGRMSPYWCKRWEQDARLSGLYVVVDLVFGDGSRVRAATVPIESGQPALPYLVEEPQWTDAYDYLNPTASPREVAVSIPSTAADPWRMILAGYPVNGTAEVALEWQQHDHLGRSVRPFSSYPDRKVVIRGNMVGPSTVGLAADGRRGTFGPRLSTVTVADPRDTENALLPPYTISPASWPTTIAPNGPHQTAIGNTYPLMFGYWERFKTFRVDAGATPWFLVAVGEVEVYRVYVNGILRADTHPDYAWVVGRGSDARGTLCTLVRFTVITTVWEEGDEVTVDAYTSDFYDNVNETFIDLDKPAPDVLDIIREVVTRFTPSGHTLLHEGLFSEARARLGYMPCRAMVNSSGGSTTRTLDWIEQGLLARSFPMITMVWQDGLYGPIVTDLNAPTMLELAEGDVYGVEAPTFAETSNPVDTFNAFSIRYDYGVVRTEDGYEEVYRREAKLDKGTSGLCAWSFATAGDQERIFDVIESEHILTDAVAERVIGWLAEHRAVPTLYLEVPASPALYFLLRRGDNVGLTLESVGLARRVFVVESLTYQRGQVMLGLRTLLRPGNTPGPLATGGKAEG